MTRRRRGSPTRFAISCGFSLFSMVGMTQTLLAASIIALWLSVGVAASQPYPRLGPLAEVRTWGYQLQDPDVEHIVGSPHDLVVIDYSRDGGDAGAFTSEDVRRMQQRPDGGRRIVLAYLSIGEAEAYRDYWRWYWGGKWYSRALGWFLAPSWLGPENRDWRGNFAVRYWEPSWQARIVGPGGYLEQIIRVGFDGVYLDKIDSSIEGIAKGRPTARDDMRAFVGRIAEAGRSRHAGFIVVPQNGEELLTDDAYAELIDGIGKEDLLFGESEERAPNPEAVIERRMAWLDRAARKGKTILAVEYLDDSKTIIAARERLSAKGYVPYFADRPLATLRYEDLPTGR